MNSLTIIGNLTKDPELRFTKTSKAYASFTIAHTPRSWDKQANSYRDGEPVFLGVTVWGDMAENVVATLQKGSRVIVAGSLKSRKYEDKDGIQRTAYELEVQGIGPDLRYASATIARNPAKGQASDWAAVPVMHSNVPDFEWSDETPF